MDSTNTLGVKHDADKVRISLLPYGVLHEVLQVLEFGSRKYADNNWMHVDNARERYYNAAWRHISAWWDKCELTDPETGYSHLSHAICCLMFLRWMDENA